MSSRQNLQQQKPQRRQRPRSQQCRSVLSSVQVLVWVGCIVLASSSTRCTTTLAFIHHDRFVARRLPSSVRKSSEVTPMHQSSVAATQMSTSTSTSVTKNGTSQQRQRKMVQKGEGTTVTLKWTDFHNDPSTTTTSPPVVLLHGLLGNKRNFASVASSLGCQLDTPRRIIGVDLRNHGDSEWSESMSYADMARDVLEFLNTEKLDQVVLVGHSMGGKVAQALSLLAPERVAGLVVLDIAPVTYCQHADLHWKAVVDILQAMHEATEQAMSSSSAAAATANGGSSKPLTKQVMDKQLRSAIPDPALRAFVLTNFGHDGWKIPLSTIVHQLERLAGFDYCLDEMEGGSSTRRRYEGDVFFIHGGQSRFVRHAYMDQIAGFFPNHMLTTIRGAGHWVHAEAPDDTVALLKRYLDR